MQHLRVLPFLLHRCRHDHRYHLAGQVEFSLLLSSAAEHLQAQHLPAPLHPTPLWSFASLAAAQCFNAPQGVVTSSSSSEGRQAVQPARWQLHHCCYLTAAAGVALLPAAVD